MDLQIYGNKSNLQRDLLERRIDNRNRHFTAVKKEETKAAIADGFIKNRDSGSYTRPKDFNHSRQNGQLDSNSKPSRTNYTSLADIYEGALRKVLNLQLNLKIEEQPRFHDGNDVIRSDKTSPPRPTAIRIDDDKHPEDFRHRRHKSDEENDSRITPKGHSVLRKLGERSTAEGSAFHVPNKRRYDSVGYEREAEFSIDHFQMSRHPTPEFPVEYGHPHFHRHPYGPRMDPVRRPRLAPSYMGPRNMVHESYPRYSRHQREVPPLFPVRCSSVERDGQSSLRGTEHEGFDYKFPDAASINTKVSVAKIDKDENEQLKDAFNKAIDNLTHHIKPSSPRHSPEQKSPHSERFQPYSRKTRSSPPAAVNGSAETNGESKCKPVENDVKHDVKKAGEDDDKEEFLSNLGLARRD